ncbi:phosphate ABC transporter permease PstA [Nocardioides sp. CN2-186]|uniref:phosphate ABC transporter permease PstA n=1 Tax=Nocardioides tweenelious TaxID=3156607 RepID=UPI0032B58F37
MTLAPDTDATSVGTTHLPSYDDDAAPAVPRGSLGRLTSDEKFSRIGTWASGAGLAWLITQRLLPLPGLPWFLVMLIVCVLLVTTVTAGMSGGLVEVRDRVAATIITVGAVVVFSVLVSAVVFVVLRGWRPLMHLNFYTHDMSGVGPKDPFDKGGVLHAIVGSLIQIGIAVAIALPLGIGTAIFMSEVGGKFARVVRTVVEAMTALPSIVAGLFIYTVFIVALGYPRSGLAAALAIAVMMLPIIARAADVVLRVVPGGLREASLALGASRWKTVWNVVLPTARPGLATAVILGIARGIGETSPVLLTSGNAQFLVTNPTDGVMNSLPLFIYSTVRSGEPNAIARAFAAATVLLAIVMILFVTARLIARPKRTKTSRRRRPAVDMVRADPLVEMGPVSPPVTSEENP